MMFTSGIRKALLGGCFLLAELPAFALPQLPQSALDLSYRIGTPALPVAAYRNISVAEFRSLVSRAFQKSDFSFVAAGEQKNKSTVFEFKFNADPKFRFAPIVLVSADELLDSKKKCNPCFLRFAEIKNSQVVKTLPWMAQYDLSAQLVPAIDNAYSSIESAGREYLDPSFEFNYKRQWRGEQTLFGNSFVGLSLSDLKENIVRAYRSAGFLSVESEAPPKASELTLTFSFPVDPVKDGGVVYKVTIYSQYDADGHCYPCEVTEHYDPYQQLPPAGLSGVLSRATLESRFTAARNAAYESMRTDLERYLRSRSVFSLPPKRAPLGSPRPQPTPMVVT
ncbi:hypothetical protein [Variovorax paradoxus]|uniref:hypothetical protein n=1 Tax=Variovorax paradoxus TaxID=34073 RepID=UPI002780DE09|nr:hypothetical protein [Variovorax paradoxus]MDP9928423.1 hypothetical protein [Variovorax paradoxus]